ncbi:complement C1q 2 [Solea senegalensis]|uniref:Complement C1q 2 n=2 Tax=Solea senegalensis TaxID=28829 RepID=A0AAV6T478_SOLSE|nr:uncharacterized protein LOC122778303 [Solea senegalensis]XP_043898745.1 uncharacterized protein LOC122780040 [Solea senegalensis]XP_043898793.1 uncharacterized protein LOC122780077 [Solea senegalensis]XP_043898807.1 uncharacterized protein LOC122780084 [Solea senegalensis]KAG7523938.1 complement C1q 2 [Solea senegalensis]KAG7526174.1 complement C1q 2 [Solea senegalensis]KAG7526178.1 complement C1q 2 [Solea senegalensis]
MMKMKTLLAVLGLSLFSLCVADLEGDELPFVMEDQVGPSTVEITHVDADAGTYDASTGLFTGTVSGNYHFSFSSEDCSPRLLTLRLLKNGEPIPTVFDHRAGSNGMVVHLNAGDQVAMDFRRRYFIHIHVRFHFPIHIHVRIGYVED